MLTTVQIRNFQSLGELNLELGRLTVVTGATGSGKSAVLRALRLAAFNARGTDYISRGAKSCQVAVGDREQAWAVGIERGVTRGRDAYRISRLPGAAFCPGDYYRDEREPQVDTFTKLGGEVPEPVATLLQISEINFAGQFDRPFLLDSSGGEIARVLGRLTNVTLLFEAAREAARRRLEIRGDLKRAEENLASLIEAAQRFRGMRERHAAVADAEAALELVQGTQSRLSRLKALAGRLEAAETALAAAERALPAVPSADRLDELADRLARARSLYAALDQGVTSAAGAQFAMDEAVKTEQAAHERLHDVLAAAGQCPTCGSTIT